MDTADDDDSVTWQSRPPYLVVDDDEDPSPDLLPGAFTRHRDVSPARSDFSAFSTLYTLNPSDWEYDAPRGRRLTKASVDASPQVDKRQSTALSPIRLGLASPRPLSQVDPRPPRWRSPEATKPIFPAECVRPYQLGTIFFDPPLWSPAMPRNLPASVRDAINSYDVDKLIALLCRQPPVVVSHMIPRFRETYNESPAQAVNKLLGGTERRFKALLVGCALGTHAFGVKILKDAFRGFTVDKNVLIDLLAGATLDDIRALKANYAVVTNLSVDAEVTKRIMSGPFQQLTYALTNVDRRSAPREEDAETDAATLYRCGEKIVGTDRAKFFDVLVNSSDSHLRQVFKTYTKYYSTPVEKVIISEFMGHRKTAKALLALVGAARDRIAHIADMFKDALYRNYHNKLVRLAVLYREADMCHMVKKAFRARHGTTLANAIKEKTSGNYKDALLACIGEAQ